MRHAADRRLALAAQKRTMVHRFEGQALAFFRQEFFDIRKRSAGAGREDQFGRLVERHADERRGGERCGCLRRPAEAGARVAADHGERRPAPMGVGDDGRDFVLISRDKHAGHVFERPSLVRFRISGCARPGIVKRQRPR
jgi:hypothetical protein